jgi:hypothetical protein
MAWKETPKMDQKVMLFQQAVMPVQQALNPIRNPQFDILPKVELCPRGGIFASDEARRG